MHRYKSESDYGVETSLDGGQVNHLRGGIGLRADQVGWNFSSARALRHVFWLPARWLAVASRASDSRALERSRRDWSMK